MEDDREEDKEGKETGGEGMADQETANPYLRAKPGMFFMARRSESTTFAGKANTFCPGLCARASQMRESRNLGQASLATSVNYMQLPQNPHRLLFLLKSASRTSAHESATE